MVMDGAERSIESARRPGAVLAVLAASHRDVQQTRLALAQRGLDGASEAMQTVEDRLARDLTAELKRHPLAPWLRLYPALGGVHAARLVSLIGDPRRFPGQRCSNGHTMEPDYAVGSPCSYTGRDGEGCPGFMQEPRTTTGTRSLWHYLGMHVVDGKSPRRRRGQQGDWNPKGRTALLQPGGIAEQIVRHRGLHARVGSNDTLGSRDGLARPVRCRLGDDCRTYRLGLLYEEQKARLTETRAVIQSDIDREGGPGLAGTAYVSERDPGETRAAAGPADEIDEGHGLRPGRIDAIARTIVAKRFAGDLLAEWKRIVAPPADDQVAA